MVVFHSTKERLTFAERKATIRPPGVSGLHWKETAAIAFVVVLGLMLVVPMPVEGRGVSALLDLSHAPLFGLLALIVVLKMRRRLSRNSAAQASDQNLSPRAELLTAGCSWLIVVATGLLTEIAQHFAGRSASWQDLFADVVGGASGILWYYGISLHRGSLRRLILLGASLTALVAAMSNPMLTVVDLFRQQRQMPVLASFEDSLELRRWTGDDCRWRRVRDHATDGSWTLEAEFLTAQYPNLTLRWPVRDWSSYKYLTFDLLLDEDEQAPTELILKVEDRAHDGDYYDRFHASLRVTHGLNTARIPLDEIANAPRDRLLDLRDIDRLQLFLVDPPENWKVVLDNFRLE